MKIAVTGGTGFAGRHLARALLADRHDVVIVARGVDKRDPSILGAGATLVAASTDDTASLRRSFSGCEAVAHFAGINREIGEQTYERVHVRGTRAVVDAARAAGVRKIVYLSFLRARPNCGSPYHESKWAAEEIVRASGVDYTILKSGVIYGRGDHLLDHVSRALYTFPFFPLVGLRPTRLRPVFVGDVVRLAHAALVDPRLSRRTIGVLGPEELGAGDAIRPIAAAVGRTGTAGPPPRIPGIGSESAKLLERMNIHTIGDLLWHLPARFDDFSKFVPLRRLIPNATQTAVATLGRISQRRTATGKLMTEAELAEEDGTPTDVRATWFGRAFVKETHREGERVRISGKVRFFGRTLQFSQPTLERADAEPVHTGRLVPIYPLTERIKPGQMRRWLHTAIEGGATRTGLVGEVP